MNTPHRQAPSPLARQALARPLTREEAGLAQALESLFGEGTHDFDAVAAQLQARQVPRPSGSAAPWTTAALEEELAAINRSLDAAYEAAGTPQAAQDGGLHG